jgi:CBS domain-containing protein
LLVSALVVGIVFINIAPDPSKLERIIDTLGGPLFAVFFVLAGFNLHLEEFAKLKMLGVIIAYVLARTAGKAFGAYLGYRSRRVDPDLRPNLGLGMLCQAGVAIGLSAFLKEHTREAGGAIFEWARQIDTIVLASVALFELVGPLLLKLVIVRAGEVKAVNLMSRAVSTGPPAGGPSWLSALGAILRRLNIAPGGDQPDETGLTARHIMRTNVKLLHASADLDEVLHFIERSRLDHFPVVTDEGYLIGTINLADVRDIIYNPQMRTLVTAADLIEPQLITATADEPLDTLFRKFHDEKIFAMPVVDSPESRRLMGIVEQRDLLRALHTHATDDQNDSGH